MTSTIWDRDVDLLDQRNGEDRHEHRGLGKGGDGHLPARTHAAERRADVHACQRRKEPCDGKERDEGDDIGRG